MNKMLALTAAAGITLGGVSMPTDVFAQKANKVLSSGIIPVGQKSSPPNGWLDFCREEKYKKDCEKSFPVPETIILNEKKWEIIRTINHDVNKSIISTTDLDNHKVPEKWDYAENEKGDCEDYVLVKKKKLIAKGFPESALLITVVKDQKGYGHAVLTVRTDRGDLALDNMNLNIVVWEKTGYKYVKIQSPYNPNEWLTVLN